MCVKYEYNKKAYDRSFNDMFPFTEFSSRPSYLKVFINPCSHKKEAVYIYREHVAPLFKIADIHTDITGK